VCSPLRDKTGDKELARVLSTLEAKLQEQLEQVQNILIYRGGSLDCGLAEASL